MLGLSALPRQAKENGHQICAMGVLSAVQHIFNETARQARTPAGKRLAKAIRASHRPRVNLQSEAKERVKRTKENSKSKGTKSENKGAKGSCKGKTSETGISGLENLNSEACSENLQSVQMGQVYIADTSWIHEECSLDE